MANDVHTNPGRDDGLVPSFEATTIPRARVHVADGFLHEPWHVARATSMGRESVTCKAWKRRENDYHVRGTRYQA